MHCAYLKLKCTFWCKGDGNRLRLTPLSTRLLGKLCWPRCDMASAQQTAWVCTVAVSDRILYVQPSLATLLMKPPSAAKSIFQDNGQTRRLRSYFPDPTEDINNKVSALLRCLNSLPRTSQPSTLRYDLPASAHARSGAQPAVALQQTLSPVWQPSASL